MMENVRVAYRGGVGVEEGQREIVAEPLLEKILVGPLFIHV